MSLTEAPQRPDPEAPVVPTTGTRHGRGDRVFKGLSTAAGLLIMLALVGVFLFLFLEGYQGLTLEPSLYRGAGSFLGYVGPLVYGTVLAAVLALLIAVPFAIALALFITFYAPRSLATPVAFVIDILAAIPSVVFGLWGGISLAKAIQPVLVWLSDHLGFLWFFSGSPSATGRTELTAAIVLALMILPIITAISREIFAQTPTLHREAAMALGATRWETIRLAVFPYARSGIVSATMLGLGRALGETMAVLMVLSASPLVTLTLITSSNPATIASNIAANYKEASATTQSLLIATGLVLFAVTFLVNAVARWITGGRDRRLAR